MAALDDLKVALRVTENDDTALIQRLLDSATAEALKFTGLTTIPDPVPADLWQGIVLMVSADYDGDPTKRNQYREAAQVLWLPHRVDWGV